MHELSLYTEFAPDEFEGESPLIQSFGSSLLICQAPYIMRHKPKLSNKHIELSPAYVGSVITCCESAKAILDIFTTLDTITLRSIYVIAYTRAFYSIIVLTKIMTCTITPESSIGKIVDPSSIKLSDYIRKIMTLLYDASGTESFAVAATFLAIVTRLSTWFYHHHSQLGPTDPNDLLEPMRYLFAKTTLNPSSINQNTYVYDGQREDATVRDLPGVKGASYSVPTLQMADFATPLSQGPPIRYSAPTLNDSSSVHPPIPAESLPLPAWVVQETITADDFAEGDSFLANFGEYDGAWDIDFLEGTSMLMFPADDIAMPGQYSSDRT